MMSFNDLHSFAINKTKIFQPIKVYFFKVDILRHLKSARSSVVRAWAYSAGGPVFEAALGRRALPTGLG